MSLARHSHNPGVLTLAGHLLVIALASAALAPLFLLRLILAPLTEAVIRVSDAVSDVLVDRLSR